MRIGILADPVDVQYAGIHVYTKNLINALIEKYPQHEYYLFRASSTGPFAGAKNIVIPNRCGMRVLKIFCIVPLLARWHKLDYVIEPAHFGPFFMPRHTRTATIIHDLGPLKHSDQHVFFSQLLQRWFLPGILRRTDLIVANSATTAQEIVETFPQLSGKVRVLYPIPEAIFHPTEDPAVLLRYGITRPYFLFVGTLEPRKNLLLLLEAFHRYKTMIGGGEQLVLVGQWGWKQGPLRQALETHTYRSDIVLAGYAPREHLPVLYSHAKAFVFPSQYEGFGLPVAEAMSCGCPCVLSDLPVLREVTKTRSSVLFFDPTSSDALCHALQQIGQLSRSEIMQSCSQNNIGEVLGL